MSYFSTPYDVLCEFMNPCTLFLSAYPRRTPGCGGTNLYYCTGLLLTTILHILMRALDMMISLCEYTHSAARGARLDRIKPGVIHMSFQRATLREFRECIKAKPCPVPDWTECYEFDGSTGYEGRKMFRSVLPTLVAVGIACGRMPRATGHRCGNPNCIRYTHLSITFFDNPRTVSRSKKRALTLDLVETVLAARPAERTRYSLAEIAKKTGVGEYVLKGIMRLAPVFDIMAEVAEWRKGGMDMSTLVAPLPREV